jgi:hypothetical protein
MKKSVYFVIVMQILFTACSNDFDNQQESFDAFLITWDLQNVYQGICTSVTDAVTFPEPWTEEVAETFTISDEIILKMSTCGLLKTWWDYPPRILGPWCSICSNSMLPEVSNFNNSLRADRVAAELFKRDDCTAVLKNKYLSVIRENQEPNGRQLSFEMLLASDMCMSILNKKEKIQLLAMALKNTKCGTETRHIMAAIMRACNYAPFLDELGTNWEESTSGYEICFTDTVEKYAKQYLNEQKSTL